MKKKLGERNKIHLDEVIQYLAKVVRTNYLDFFELDNGSLILKDLNKIPIELQSLIIATKSTRHGPQIQLPNKMDAIDKLMKHLGGYKSENFQQVEQKDNVIIYLPDNGALDDLKK